MNNEYGQWRVIARAKEDEPSIISVYVGKYEDVFEEVVKEYKDFPIIKLEKIKKDVSLDVLANKLAEISNKLDKIYEVIKPIGTTSLNLNVENINNTDFNELIESIKKYQSTRI